MQFLALIYDNEAQAVKKTDAEHAQTFQDYMAFNETAKSRGSFIGGDALLPTNTAMSVRVRDGKVLATDGPFAETKEQLGGYYLLDCKDIEDAIDLASKIPAANTGTIEVRPIMLLDEK